MVTQVEQLTNKVMGLFGKESQTERPLWIKAAVVGGSITALFLISLLPVTISVKKDILINKSSTDVYNYLTQSDPTLLWPTIHPGISAASVKKENKKKQILIVSSRMGGGSPVIFEMNLKKNSTAKTILLDALVPVFYGMRLDAKIKIVDKTRKKCKFQETVNVRLPILLAIFGGRGTLNRNWGAALPIAVKNGVENS